jgi:hypothetical protein
MNICPLVIQKHYSGCFATSALDPLLEDRGFMALVDKGEQKRKKSAPHLSGPRRWGAGKKYDESYFRTAFDLNHIFRDVMVWRR